MATKSDPPTHLTITMKIEVDLQDLPPGTPLNRLNEELTNIEGWAQECKREMEEEISDDPEMKNRMTVTVEVEKKP